MKIIIMLLIVILQLGGCDSKVKYSKQRDGKNHVIDFGPFSIIVPTDFKYEKSEGIDSFVGKIRNKESIFYFDYGLYSPRPKLTREQFIEINQKNLDLKSEQLFFGMIDLKPYQNEKGAVKPIKITQKIENLTLNRMTDSVVLSNGRDKNCKYYYAFRFENKDYKLPFCIPKEISENFKYYDIKADTINNYKRIISIWKNENFSKFSSVNLMPLNNDPNEAQLWIGINTDKKINIKQIREIFESVRIENN